MDFPRIAFGIPRRLPNSEELFEDQKGHIKVDVDEEALDLIADASHGDTASLGNQALKRESPDT